MNDEYGLPDWTNRKIEQREKCDMCTFNKDIDTNDPFCHLLDIPINSVIGCDRFKIDSIKRYNKWFEKNKDNIPYTGKGERNE